MQIRTFGTRCVICTMQMLSTGNTESVVNSDKSFPMPKFQTRQFSITWRSFEQQVNRFHSTQKQNALTLKYVRNRPHNKIKILPNILCDVNSYWQGWTPAQTLEKLIYRNGHFYVDTRTKITLRILNLPSDDCNSNATARASTHTHTHI